MAINLLIIIDGIYRFGEPAAVSDFTFKTLVDTLMAAGMNVATAHRETMTQQHLFMQYPQTPHLT